MYWYLQVLQKYAEFTGRARRMEYWMFVLINLIAAIMASILDAVILGRSMEQMGPIYSIYMLAVLVPSIAVSIRRLHDIGKSGWWLLLSLVPIVGGIWLLILMCLDSQPEENAYGPNPKVIAATTR